MPLLAPPKGRSAIAFFQVIARARPMTSSTVTSGTILMPPLPGPLAVLWITHTPCIWVFWSYTSMTLSNPNSSSLRIAIDLAGCFDTSSRFGIKKFMRAARILIGKQHYAHDNGGHADELVRL